MKLATALGTLVLAAPLAVGLTAVSPAGVAEAAGVCRDGSRDAAKKAARAPDMREVDQQFSVGDLASAEITLRHSASNNCAWGLLEGHGVIWIERQSPWGTWDHMSEMTLDLGSYSSVTHTAAFDLSMGRVRACGRGINGSNTSGSSSSVSGGTDGVSGSESDSESTETSWAQKVCTVDIG
jgi:hypothetical protein